jgi:hypothetical protein
MKTHICDSRIRRSLKTRLLPNPKLRILLPNPKHKQLLFRISQEHILGARLHTKAASLRTIRVENIKRPKFVIPEFQEPVLAAAEGAELAVDCYEGGLEDRTFVGLDFGQDLFAVVVPQDQAAVTACGKEVGACGILVQAGDPRLMAG